MKNFFVLAFLFLSISNSYGCEEEYLDLMKKCLTDSIYNDQIVYDNWSPPPLEKLNNTQRPNLQGMNNYEGLTSLENMMRDVTTNGIEGDFCETGIWRGGTCIFMRAFLKATGDTDRIVWCADSFEGVPPPSYKQDKGLDLHLVPWLAVSLEEVQSNFRRYGLLDGQVQFLKGWFKDTLKKAPIEKLAILRLDGDLYESTMDSLIALYDKVSVGGYVIIDDFGAIDACARAVNDFRSSRGIKDPIIADSWSVVYWKKTS
jgi:O-methyltransferase